MQKLPRITWPSLSFPNWAILHLRAAKGFLLRLGIFSYRVWECEDSSLPRFLLSLLAQPRLCGRDLEKPYQKMSCLGYAHVRARIDG